MKNCLFTFLFLSFISCGESYVTIDTEMINKDIYANDSIKTPEDLIILYYNYPKNESKPNLEITKRFLKKDLFEIILIHDHMDDDSQKAEKIVMTAKRTGKKWRVEKILRNWKCYDDRGHSDWGTENCN